MSFEDEVVDPDLQELAKEFGLSYDMIVKLYNGDPEKLVYQWAKTGHINYGTFRKLLRYLVEK